MSEVCLAEADLVLALDKSGSVKEKGWKEVVNFAKNLLDQFKVSSNDTHAGIIAFGSNAETYIDLNTKGKNKVDVSHALKLLESAWDDPWPQTMTHLGLEKAVKMMRGSIRPVQKILIIVTDGKSTIPPKLPTQIKALEQLKVTTFSIGVGRRYNRKELLQLANNQENRVVEITDFSNLVKAVEKVIKVICKKTWV